MTGTAAGSAPAFDRQTMRRDIIAFLQNEIQDRKVVLTMDTPTEAVVIDSLDIARVFFRIEEKYGCEILLFPELSPKTVGELVDALIDTIPTVR